MEKKLHSLKEYPEDTINGAVQKKKTSKIPLVVGLIVFFVIAGAAALVGAFLIKRTPPENAAVVKETVPKTENKKNTFQVKNDSNMEQTGTATSGSTVEPVPELIPEPTPEMTAVPVDVFQKYYDEMDARFGKYIVSTKEAVKIDTYSNMLRDALVQKDAEMCGIVKKKLDTLEKRLAKISERKLSVVKREVSKWEKKGSSKKVKKSKTYKKVKQDAEKLEKEKNYARAKMKYLECLKRLKKATGKKAKKER